MTARPAVLDVGARIGPYRIVGELGGGGMGLVYRGAHVALRRHAAIKVLRPELSDRADAIERFLAEACTAAAVHHPGIVEVYDYGTSGGRAFLAMELLDGETLGARLAARGRFNVFEAVVLARRIAAPLAAAHDRGIVHRDLKPDNVFLVRDHEGGAIDQVKLFDFGVATLDGAGAERATGLVLGTPAYMSPEQCRGSVCDHRSDLYALGCMLFELVTGQPPYGSAGTPDQLGSAHLMSQVPDVRRSATVPAELARLVTRLLAKRAEDRPRDAHEVVAELDRWLTHRAAAPIHGVVRAARGVVVWIASLFAMLRRFRPRRPALPPTRRARADTETPTVVVRRPVAAGMAGMAMTSAPTQPMVELAPPSPFVPTPVPVPGRTAPAPAAARADSGSDELGDN